MKYITVPSNVKITGVDKEITFHDFLHESILKDSKLAKTADDVYTMVKLIGLFTKDTVVPGEVLEVEDEDYKRLLAVAKAPSHGYNGIIAAEIFPFLEALGCYSEDKVKKPEKD